MTTLEIKHRSPETIKPQKHVITTTVKSIVTSRPKHDDDMTIINEIPVRYTSLKEVLPANYVRSCDGVDIQIKNPLVKQAALAYLSPRSRSTPKGEDHNWLMNMFTFRFQRNNSYFGVEGEDRVSCIDYFKDVVLRGLGFGRVFDNDES